MKKILFTIALTALLLLVTSGYNRDNAGTRIGNFAPELALNNTDSSMNLSQMRGKYLLLNFWSSSDALSRAESSKYSAWVDANKPNDLKYVAVNFDSQPALFEEIARLDNLDLKAQFNVQGKAAEQIMRDYNLASGFGTMLIGPDGRIKAINPSVSDLSSL